MRAIEGDETGLGDARRALLDHILSTLRDITGLSAGHLDEATRFDEIGLESLAVTAFTARLEPHFPALQKAFMFECRSARGVCDHLLENYPEPARALAAMLLPARGPRPEPARGLAPIPDEDPWPEDAWPEFEPIGAVAGSPPTAIAVIGMHGRFPDAPTPDAFWTLLAEGRDAVGEVPPDRWPMDDFFEPGTNSRRTGRSYAKWGGFLDGIDLFDAQFFGVSARDAAVMDPQERLFLECAWHAMENAALAGPRLDALRQGDGFDVGVFVGVTTTSYQLLGPEGWHGPAKEVPTAMPWSVANRVSYALNFQGPSLAIDTACSSSLVALHSACGSLAKGECKVAIAGGVNIYTHPAKLIQLCQHGMLSPTGRCHSFGEAADGFAPGEGVGALVLKPLDAAMADGDRILAVIRGSAVNHSGRTNGYTVPSAGSQARLVAHALAGGGVDPRTISCIEAHGTGTKLGDPIELAGLTEALDAGAAGHPIAVGSVKANIGHLESAAGVAGMIKTILQMRRRTLAPSLHSRTLNPALGIAGTRFFVPQGPTPWRPEPGCGVLRAGVSSFGAGGVNAHAILEEAPSRPPAAAQGPLVFPLSARSPEQVDTLARALRATLDRLYAGPDAEAVLAALAYTLQCGRHVFAHRLALVAEDAAQLRRALDAEGPASGAHRGHVPPGSERPGIVRVDENAASLARRWAAGEDIGWSALWRVVPEPTDAPLYPFLAERHWLTRDEAAAHPGAVTVSGDHPGLEDHRIAGEAVLPATAGIDACYRAALSRGMGPAVEFENLNWLQPLALAHLRARPAALRFSPAGDGLRFELVSGDGGDVIVHVRGHGRAAALPDPAHGPLDAARIRERCRPVGDVGRAYVAFRALGMDYGPRFQALGAAWIGQGEALVEARCPPDADRPANAPLSPALLDPALFDGALQAAALAAGLLDGRLSTAFIPLHAEKLRVYGALPERILVHVRERGEGGKVRHFDYRITTHSGAPLIDIQGFAFRSMALTPGAPAVSLLEPEWVAAPLPDGAAAVSGPLLVVGGGRSLFDA
ncbi:MAG TPA: beta-ketoacyl synthase N-terminal-like domain-containing protein, partial [Azospirillum sp.]